MTNPQSVVSVFYDAKQDRLNFLLRIDNQEEVEGVMTRRLLKSMLVQLPEWLAQQSTRQKENDVTQAQQHAINQFQYQAAQQQPVEQRVVKRNKETASFFIEAINLSSVSKLDDSKGIAVQFISFDKQDKINLTFTIKQFHQFIAIILAKASDWNLASPWGTEVPGNNPVIH